MQILMNLVGSRRRKERRANRVGKTESIIWDPCLGPKKHFLSNTFGIGQLIVSHIFWTNIFL